LVCAFFLFCLFFFVQNDAKIKSIEFVPFCSGTRIARPAGEEEPGLTLEIPQDSVLLLEGGAFRGTYTCGVLDALMEKDLYFPAVAGVSAGVLAGVNYLSHQPGRGARCTLCYRHDPRYVGAVALLRNRGLFGFDYMFGPLLDREYFDRKTFAENPAKFYAVATNVDTGRAALFEKSTTPDFMRAMQASASMPVCSLPVKVGGGRYLDGGCACAIPLSWALKKDFRKVVVVATRDRGYRKTMPSQRMVDLYTDFYGAHTEFLNDLLTMDWRYNRMLDHMDALEDSGRIFVLRPRKPVEVGRLESSTEKLLALVNEGHDETFAALDGLENYLHS
jgi:predicted patatin/cPLA2 family phospholipase